MPRYINRRHLARAVLEAPAYQTREALPALRKDSGVQLARLQVDGGVVVNALLRPLQSDAAGIPGIRPEVPCTTSPRAAYAAGLAVGYWGNLEELRQYWQEDKRWEPRWDEARRERAYRGWLRAVERARGWLED